MFVFFSLPPCDGDCGEAQTVVVSNIKHTFQEEHNHVFIITGALDYKFTRVFSTLEESIVPMLNVCILCRHKVFNPVKCIILLSRFYVRESGAKRLGNSARSHSK